MEYEKVASFEALMQAADECKKGARWKATTQNFEINQLRWVADLKTQLDAGKYKGRGFNNFTITERGKVRHIQSVHISERTVQKSLVKNALYPAIVPSLIYDNAATLKGRGTEFALKRLRKHLAHHYRKHGRKGGILIMDWHNYFGSINHDILLSMLRKKIDDDKIFAMCETFIRAFDGDVGLGLGSEISQISAVFFPNEIDHHVKEKLRIRGYGRYMDDLYVISEDIDKLQEARRDITKMSEALGLQINEKRTQIVKFDGGHFTYLKKRFYITPSGKIVMRLAPANVRRRRRKLKSQKRLYDNGKIGLDAVEQSYQSWRSYASKCNARKTIDNMDRLYRDLFPEGRLLHNK